MQSNWCGVHIIVTFFALHVSAEIEAVFFVCFKQ